MRPRSAAALCLLALSLFASRPATAEIITFEEMTPNGGAVPVLDFYANRGVIFRASAIDYTKGPPILANFVHSGTNAIETCFAIEFCTSPIEVTFTQAQAHVSAFAGFDGALGETVTVVMRGFASRRLAGGAGVGLDRSKHDIDADPDAPRRHGAHCDHRAGHRGRRERWRADVLERPRD